MKLFTFLILLALICSAFAVPTNKLTTSSHLSFKPSPGLHVNVNIAYIQDVIKKNGGCNLNLCFALDGSGSISTTEYTLQKDFVLQVVAALAGNPRQVSAVQYGLDNCPISTLTSDVTQFLLDVSADQIKSAPKTFMAGGIAYCERQLRNMGNDANKIVVIGDGRSNFGGDPVPLADLFRSTGGEICSVGVKFKDTQVQTLIDVANGRDHVFTTQDYQGIFDIIEPLVFQMCGVVN